MLWNQGHVLGLSTVRDPNVYPDPEEGLRFPHLIGTIQPSRERDRVQDYSISTSAPNQSVSNSSRSRQRSRMEENDQGEPFTDILIADVTQNQMDEIAEFPKGPNATTLLLDFASAGDVVLEDEGQTETSVVNTTATAVTDLDLLLRRPPQEDDTMRESTLPSDYVAATSSTRSRHSNRQTQSCWMGFPNASVSLQSIYSDHAQSSAPLTSSAELEPRGSTFKQLISPPPPKKGGRIGRMDVMGTCQTNTHIDGGGDNTKHEAWNKFNPCSPSLLLYLLPPSSNPDLCSFEDQPDMDDHHLQVLETDNIRRLLHEKDDDCDIRIELGAKTIRRKGFQLGSRKLIGEKKKMQRGSRCGTSTRVRRLIIRSSSGPHTRLKTPFAAKTYLSQSPEVGKDDTDTPRDLRSKMA